MKLNEQITYGEHLLEETKQHREVSGWDIYDAKIGWLESVLSTLRKCKESGPEKDQNHNEFVAAYFEFYKERIGVKPKFTAADGKAIKEIKAYLETVVQDPFYSWKFILQNWQKLTPFIANQCTAMAINKNINEILSQLKYGTSKADQRNEQKRVDARDVLSSYD